MKRNTLRAWFHVHRWSSLVCTLFLLLLCVTGLPLIFWHEILHLTGGEPELPAASTQASPVSVDRLVAQALAKRPADVPLYVSWEEDEPRVTYVTTGPRPGATNDEMHVSVFDALTGQAIPAPQFNEGIMWVFYRLHTDLYAGLPGLLFMGLMGLLLVLAIVSGVVLYAPYMRKLPFGVLRGGQRRLAWLDWHNLTGIVTLGWLSVVGLTGVINTLEQPIVALWQQQHVAHVLQEPANVSPPRRPQASLQAAIDAARARHPDAIPSWVAFPGTGYSGNGHYGVMLRGDTPLTARLLTPVFANATTGELAGSVVQPAWMQALLLSQPLHFGDYAGLPLKILWALLDIVAIVVLASGLVLFVRRGSRAQIEARIDARMELAR
jgi:uncharacterized iron-regulated membrane protein